jgi:ribonucleoside-diphosphate reductase alpha chain
MNALSELSNQDVQEISRITLLEKYAKGTESTILDIQTRVASALVAVEPAHRRAQVLAELCDAQLRGLIFAGRISSAAGTELQATLANCFVQPIGDSITESSNGVPGIYAALSDAAETMRKGGGVGYDFSAIRPSGAWVRGTQSNASGPVSYMRVFDRSCETVESAGSRRGAQMGVLRCDHPDIERFIHAKDDGDLSNFNLSVGVTDDFMHAVVEDQEIELWHGAEPSPGRAAEAYQRADGNWVYARVRASDLWESIMRSTYDHAEPGVLFLDRINRSNNLWYCETISATNPCAEQPLPPYGCCCLASINLTRFVIAPFGDQPVFDWASLEHVVGIAVRGLDNVLDVTHWPLERQRAEAMAKRRIGLGFLGLGDALIMMGIGYDTEEGREFAAKISRCMRDTAYRASIELAKERGPFPLFDSRKYLEGSFVDALPEDIRAGIAEHGIRNSHLLSIAPTGTISLAFADNASNGIEPAFQWVYLRRKRGPDGRSEEYEVADHAWRVYRQRGLDMTALPHYFKTALEISAKSHAEMLKSVQPFIDGAISKTVNIPEDYPFEDFRGLYLQAWKDGLKGLATYRPNATLGAVLQPLVQASDVNKQSPQVQPDQDPLSLPLGSRPHGDLIGVTRKAEYWTVEGKKTVYLTINFACVTGVIDGVPVTVERPIEFFMPAGQQEAQAWVTSNMRMLSMVARSGAPIEKALANMLEVVWDKGPVRCEYVVRSDGQQVPKSHPSDVAAIAYSLQQMLVRRGFLDAMGRQIPAAVLAKRGCEGIVAQAEVPARVTDGKSSFAGRPCPECGNHSVVRRDGCLHCDTCHWEGSCG